MKNKKLLPFITLIAFPLISLAGDLGNETDEPNGRSTSISIDMCEERMSFRSFQQEMRKKEGYRLAFDTLKENYLPFYEKIMEQGGQSVICMTAKPINLLNPGFPSNKPRVALWVAKGEGARDSLQFDPGRYFDPRKDDVERAVIVIRELLHESAIEKYENPNQRSWVMHNLTNEIYDLLSNPITDIAIQDFLLLLESYKFLDIPNYLYSYCKNSVEACETRHQFLKEIGIDVLRKNSFSDDVLLKNADSIQGLDNLFAFFISQGESPVDSISLLNHITIGRVLLESDFNDFKAFLSRYPNTFQSSSLRRVIEENVRHGVYGKNVKQKQDYLKEQGL